MFTGYMAPNAALRPALRLKLGTLLLSAHSENQTQVLDDDDSLRLTFADENWSLKDSKLDSVPGTLMVDADEDASIDGYGWKAVDPTAEDGSVFASGFSEDGNIDTSVFPAGKVLDFYFWGQENGSAEKGWSNRATTANRVTIKDGKEYVPRSFDISLTGQTSGTLTAYRIGEYDETMFTQTGALKSVRLDTPEGLGTVLKTAAETAGGSDVDADNPVGWVAARWLGYPTDPLSDDVTSAFSPYAGQLQLFAQALAEDTSGLTAESVTLDGLDAPVDSPVTLSVSGPGLYLIVDSSGASLPIVVGTKVFNEVLGEDGGFVDFADAGVKGKPRLGQAALKTTVTDIAKRIVNDAGLDGFDVGSEVEYEIALRVPDLNDFSVPYDAYEFRVEDTADSGLTLPDASGVKVLLDTPSPDTDVTGALPSSSVTVSGQTLTLTGLKTLFADDNGSSGVTNKLPAGSLIRIRYRAVLNKEHATYAVPTSGLVAANMNEAKLTRSHVGAVSEGWTDAGSGVESKMVTANAYSFRVELSKRDKDDLSTTLVGARFKVLRDGRPLDFVEVPAAGSGVYRLAVAGDTGVTQSVETVADGKLTVQGVEARELVFEEIAAPSGYFKVSDFTVDVRPIWDADATLVTELAYVTSGSNLAYVSEDGRQVMVLDPAWSLANLPYTGGMGILVLLVVGGLVLAFAIRPYILSKRAERDANLV
ncbi:isopeptide-forming domain-containing fimbrial protein [Bifidobacterium crudilactis]|jgi:fimbrial isopeptide formation D2 family protein|uniref:isopeptide-forming domain-containing fimbrial protein n=1 Tax=Bifidobacterium crudilactis TaxID=327277 RepID=UPI002F34F338